MKIRAFFCGFADGWSEANPVSEDIEPSMPQAYRRNYLSVKQIQDSGFADGWSEANPVSEDIEPSMPQAYRRNYLSVKQIQDSGFADGRRVNKVTPVR